MNKIHKRLEKEIREIETDNEIKMNNIYCKFIKKEVSNSEVSNNEEVSNSEECELVKYKVLSEVKVLIIGPSDSPYENGFFFFTLTITDKFPFEPPKVKFESLDKNVRFHPNLYTEGKVCLSILGTWSGPGWAPCMSIKSVLLSIQSIMTANAIRNEPGYVNISKKQALPFDKLVEYNKFKYGVIKMLKQTPNGFECFKSIMITYFNSNKSYYEKYIVMKLEDTKTQNYKETLKDSFYGKPQIADYKLLKSLLNSI